MLQVKRGVLVSVLLVFVLVFVSACGNRSESGDNQASSPAPSQNEQAGDTGGTDAPKPEKLTALVDNNFTPYMQKIGEEFTKQYGVKVDVITTDYNSLHNKLVTSLASGDSSLDVFELDTVWPKEFQKAGFIVPVDSYLSKDIIDNLTSAYEQFLIDDKLYALPADNELKFMFYNAKMLKDGGYDAPPKTWDELIAMSKDLQAKGIAKYGIASAWKQAEGLLCDYAVYLNAFGGKFQDDSGNWVFNQGGGLKALEFMVGMLKDKVADPAASTLDDGTVLNTFQGGGIPFMLNWSFAVSALRDNPDIKMALIPGVKDGQSSSTVTGGGALAISNFSQNKEWAGKLLAFTSEHRQDILISDLVGGLSPYKDMSDSPALKQKYPAIDVMTQQLEYKIIRPKVSDYSDWSQTLQVALSKAVLGSVTPQQALDEAKKTLDSKGIK